MALALLLFASSLLVGLATAQTPGQTPEVHPRLDTWQCSQTGGCVKQNTSLVLDSGSHWVHQASNTSFGCGDWGSAPNKTVCPDEATCAKNCVMEGISDYAARGIVTSGGTLTLQQLTKDGSALSPRVYLLAEGEHKYAMLKLKGGELSFDVDVSKLPCGMNGALYLSEMDETGGQSQVNTAGAFYGTGYCDAQCYTTPFINGVGNIGAKGACCNEMDIWEANSRATSLAPHVCNKTGLYKCTGDECAFNGVCDKNGCGQNPYRADKTYYGARMKVDTSRPFTVVTQFPVTTDGTLSQITRLYVQNGKVVQNANVTNINDSYCNSTGASRFMSLGAVKGMGTAMARGMVLVMSVWWDDGGSMNWLDSGDAGPCNATEGGPSIIKKVQPDTAVKFSNIRWGELGSTW